MSLSKQDLEAVSTVVSDAIRLVIDPRFDGLENRMDGLENRMDGLENRMDGLENRMQRQEEAQHETNRRLSSLEVKVDDINGRLQALENDIKEIYKMLAGLQQQGIANPKFSRLSAEKRLLKVHAELATLAHQLDVKLPDLPQ